ncbi:MAG: hypothetical protein A2Y54_05920 [Chloroflexi bacterium RBG_16_51_16]|nr:MAG: hypothetical protein A2Y54_05920 [Chloroflexi bacterium RBG_16_51_16]
MSNFFRNLYKVILDWLDTRSAVYWLGGFLSITYLFFFRLKAYLVAHHGNEIGAITDPFYRQAYDVAFFSFVVVVILFFLWSVLERGNKIILALGCLSIGILAAYQLFYISKDTVYGDLSARQNLIIDPRYKYLRIENNENTRQFKAPGRLSADFAVVYFSTQNNSPLEDAYTSNVNDPWGRYSNYPPIFHYLCSLTFCNLDYGPASLTHLLLQLGFFLAGFIFIFNSLKLTDTLLPNLILVSFCLFLTPVGLAWFERGQFTLYVGLAYLCLIFGLLKQNRIFILLSAFFSFIKWTAFPFTVTLLAIYALSSANLKEFKQRLGSVFLYGSIALILFIIFWSASLLFLNGLIRFEQDFEPTGINLAYFLPVTIVKFLPLFLVILGLLLYRKKGPVQVIPFYAGIAVLFTIYPTHAYDYSLPALLALIPFLLYWSKIPEGSIAGKKLTVYLYYIFLIAASFSIRLFVTEQIQTGAYLLVACFLIFVSSRALPKEPLPGLVKSAAA